MLPKDKFDKAMQLSESKGYATALRDLLGLVRELVGDENETTIQVGQISQLAEIVMMKLPDYQDFLKYQKEHGK